MIAEPIAGGKRFAKLSIRNRKTLAEALAQRGIRFGIVDTPAVLAGWLRLQDGQGMPVGLFGKSGSRFDRHAALGEPSDGATADLGNVRVAGIERILQDNCLAWLAGLRERIAGNHRPRQSKIGRASGEDPEAVEARRIGRAPYWGS